MKKRSSKSKSLANEALEVFPVPHLVGKAERIPIVFVEGTLLYPNNIIPLTQVDGFDEQDLRRALDGQLVFGVVPMLPKGQSVKSVVPEGASLLHSMDGQNEDFNYFYSSGTEAKVNGVVKLPNGSTGFLVRGLRRFHVVDMPLKKGAKRTAMVRWLSDALPETVTEKDLHKQRLACRKTLRDLISKFVKLQHHIPSESIAYWLGGEDVSDIAYQVIPHLSLSMTEKLKIFLNCDEIHRVKMVIEALSRETELAVMSQAIKEGVRHDIQENVRRSYLKEQLQALKRELGDADTEDEEIEQLEADLEALPLNPEARSMVDRELDRLEVIPPGAPEYMVSWNYLTWIKDLPWADQSKVIPSMADGQSILEKRHFGLDKVKDRILDYLAVMHHREGVNGQILLLSGPPGVGKTSLVKSIAEALGRPFQKISLGGVKDESEIRGHRRTYIGAMPGKIITALKAAKSRQAVILLDEIDKIGRDHGRDLSSALLEVLDPEQNQSFVDHYLGVPFDLSKVVFIATANDVGNIPRPLLDRMDVLEVPSYCESEKLAIASGYLVPLIRNELNLKARQLKMSDDAILEVIRKYTREAGVRQLHRELSRIGRKIVRAQVEAVTPTVRKEIKKQHIASMLGPEKYIEDTHEPYLQPGVAIGLAYTSIGGDVLYIESTLVRHKEGRGQLILTGSLGKVMKESAQTALTYIKARLSHLIAPDFFNGVTIHLHLPDGATPKDGPSAGAAIVCALTSLCLDASMPSDLAMTGEISLRGQVMPVGGIREKLLAAYRCGKKRILIPRQNFHDLDDLPAEVRSQLSIFPVTSLQEVLTMAGLWNVRDNGMEAQDHDRSGAARRRGPAIPAPYLS